MCPQDLAQYYIDQQQDQQRANQQLMDQQRRARQKNKHITCATILVVAIVGGLWWFSGSPGKAYGVWRVVGPSDMSPSEARMAASVMDQIGVGMYFEFSEKSFTLHVVSDEGTLSNTEKCEWTARRGKLYYKGLGCKDEYVITIVDDNTMTLMDPDSRRGKGMMLTRAALSDVKATKKKGAGTYSIVR
jgi:hypothetical protein